MRDPSIGDLVGLTRERLVAHGACRGLPCPIRSVDLVSGTVATIVAAAGQATLVGTDDRPQVVYELDPDGSGIGSIEIDGTGARTLPIDRAGRRLVAGPDLSLIHI